MRGVGPEKTATHKIAGGCFSVGSGPWNGGPNSPWPLLNVYDGALELRFSPALFERARLLPPAERWGSAGLRWIALLEPALRLCCRLPVRKSIPQREPPRRRSVPQSSTKLSYGRSLDQLPMRRITSDMASSLRSASAGSMSTASSSECSGSEPRYVCTSSGSQGCSPS